MNSSLINFIARGVIIGLGLVIIAVTVLPLAVGWWNRKKGRIEP